MARNYLGQSFFRGINGLSATCILKERTDRLFLQMDGH